MNQLDKYRDEMWRIVHTQPVIQSNGLFHIYNLNERDVDSIVRRLETLPYIENVRKVKSGKYNFNNYLPGMGKLPESYWEITGWIKTEGHNMREHLKHTRVMQEDLITDNRSISDPMSYLFRNISVDANGNIGSFVEIRDDYDDTTLYQALTSMFMRVCINLRHRNEIRDLGWKYSEDERVAWKFGLNNKYFVFTSTPDSFDVYKSIDGRNYYKVIHANHSHCTNKEDIATVLDDDRLGYGDGQTPVAAPRVEVDRVREVVRTAVSNEIRQTVTTAVRQEVERSIRNGVSGSVRGSIGSIASNIPGIASNISADGRGVEVNDDFINRIVEAVIRALQENHII